MEIKQTQEKLELKYVLGTGLIEGKLEQKYFDGKEEVTYTKTIQEVARIDATVTLFARYDSEASKVHEASIKVIGDLYSDGVIDRSTSVESRKIGAVGAVKNPDFDGELRTRLTDKIECAFPDYDSKTTIDIHSIGLMHVGYMHEAELVKPYLDEIINRAIEDAKRTLENRCQ